MITKPWTQRVRSAARSFGICSALVALAAGGWPAQSALAAGSMAGSMTGAGAMAPMPASLHCGAVKPVWVNSKTHVYHLSSDPEYGRTKSGMYMCASQAVAAGNRRAGKPMMPGGSASPRP